MGGFGHAGGKNEHGGVWVAAHNCCIQFGDLVHIWVEQVWATRAW